MPSAADIQAILNDVSYRPGWRFRAVDTPEGVLVRIDATLPDSRNPGRMVDIGIDSVLDPFVLWAGRDELLRWLAWRLQRVEIHESQEWFRYRGELHQDPHENDWWPPAPPLPPL